MLFWRARLCTLAGQSIYEVFFYILLFCRFRNKNNNNNGNTILTVVATHKDTNLIHTDTHTHTNSNVNKITQKKTSRN